MSGGKVKPVILVAGGRPRDESGMIRALSLAFEEMENPLVAYIGTANEDDLGFFAMMKEILVSAGAAEVLLVSLAKEQADVVAAKETLEAADVVFFAGGEVDDGMEWLRKHSLTDYLIALYHRGKQFAGVSAGVIMMGNYWVRWDDEEDDNTAELFTCLGLAPLLFDVHGEDEDWHELQVALQLLGDGAKGYGIPSGGAASADHKGLLINLQKEVLTFTNENGAIRQL